ncbi:hypothetical protein M404DRAFT_902801 [Pisolithus tinctorius Marx 270]|uniref:Uncharacterized protein n=1 Tax=Pisolithus tinctorius Marx 270 TaxID=870435 RepID=A0A0C3PPF2_PISTI|nr:hypothetical protein M404DRAFT_902801 [Pisolithus tinctorius Marx 270]
MYVVIGGAYAYTSVESVDKDSRTGWPFYGFAANPCLSRRYSTFTSVNVLVNLCREVNKSSRYLCLLLHEVRVAGGRGLGMSDACTLLSSSFVRWYTSETGQ